MQRKQKPIPLQSGPPSNIFSLFFSEDKNKFDLTRWEKNFPNRVNFNSNKVFHFKLAKNKYEN